MKELADLLDEAVRHSRDGQAFALATVVKIEGSAYRRPGARMLALPQGNTCGTISGGCLEGEVARHGLQVLETGQARLLTFDVDEDDPFLGFGNGCGGTVHVFVESVSPSDAVNPVALLDACLSSRRAGVLATVFAATEGLQKAFGAHTLLLDDETWQGTSLPPPLHDALRADARAALQERQPQIRRYSWPEAGTAEVLFEVVRPPLRLVACGEGHDVAPLVRLSKALGWQVVVVGRRPADELATRFPLADAHVFVMHPETVAEHVPLDRRTAAVVMTHNFLRDQALLGALMTSPVSYLGVLGPLRRTARMLADLPPRTAAQQKRLFGPAGLDMSSESPEEIALSIVAEIQAVVHGRSGGPLRERDGPIHEAVPVS